MHVCQTTFSKQQLCAGPQCQKRWKRARELCTSFLQTPKDVFQPSMGPKKAFKIRGRTRKKKKTQTYEFDLVAVKLSEVVVEAE